MFCAVQPSLRHARWEQGDVFLPGVDMVDIESLHAGSTDYKVKCMLQAARLKAMQFIGADIQSSQNCKKYRLCVTAASGCRRHQTHTRREESWKAMPPLLNKKNRLRRDLGKNPTKCGSLRSSWTVKIVTCHIKQVQSGIRCKRCTAADKKDWFLCHICKTRAVQLCHA